MEEVGDGGVRQDVVSPPAATAPYPQVTTAVTFLENDRVRSSTEEMKRKFLEKKGLTEAEIAEAFGRVSVARPPPALHPATLANQATLVSRPSMASRVRDLLNLLLLIGGASYGLRYLWKVGSRREIQDRI